MACIRVVLLKILPNTSSVPHKPLHRLALTGGLRVYPIKRENLMSSDSDEKNVVLAYGALYHYRPLDTVAKFNVTLRWCSGNMEPSHDSASGSIPERSSFFALQLRVDLSQCLPVLFLFPLRYM